MTYNRLPTESYRGSQWNSGTGVSTLKWLYRFHKVYIGLSLSILVQLGTETPTLEFWRRGRLLRFCRKSVTKLSFWNTLGLYELASLETYFATLLKSEVAFQIPGSKCSSRRGCNSCPCEDLGGHSLWARNIHEVSNYLEHLPIPWRMPWLQQLLLMVTARVGTCFRFIILTLDTVWGLPFLTTPTGSTEVRDGGW